MEGIAADGGGLILWTILTFALLCLALARFAFKPLHRLLQAREDSVRGALDSARKAREDAERILSENERRLGEARDETRRIIGDGSKIVADMKQLAREKAEREAGVMIANARAEVEQELQRSLDELKGAVANLSVRIARQVIKETLNEDRHRELADDFIERLKKTHASPPA